MPHVRPLLDLPVAGVPHPTANLCACYLANGSPNCPALSWQRGCCSLGLGCMSNWSC